MSIINKLMQTILKDMDKIKSLKVLEENKGRNLNIIIIEFAEISKF